MQALGIAFVSLAEGIDATTPAGKLQMHILAAIAEFERARIAERVRAHRRQCFFPRASSAAAWTFKRGGIETVLAEESFAGTSATRGDPSRSVEHLCLARGVRQTAQLARTGC